MFYKIYIGIGFHFEKFLYTKHCRPEKTRCYQKKIKM